MNKKTSERLIRLNEKIMKEWEKRAQKVMESSIQNNSLALRNSLPEFLDLIAVGMKSRTTRDEARTGWEKKESIRLGKKHGHERATESDYSVDQLILEYHILRQVIYDVMEEEEPLNPIEREIVVSAIEHAVKHSATEFVETLKLMQERFTHTLAHDLRGPVMVAKLSSQILLSKTDDNQHGLHILRRISNSMDRLEHMINDLLDAGKIRAGEKLALEFDECELSELLEEIVDEVNFLHGDRVIFTKEGRVTGYWNAVGIRRIVDNLVSNALKFSSPNSKITIGLSRTEKEVAISVHNFGNPIPEEDIEDLFEIYHRARSAEKRKGWGIGLTVVSGLTDAHHGYVDVKSSEKEGTTFKVVLPLNNT